MPDPNRSIGDAIKISACIEAAMQVVSYYGADDEAVIKQIDGFARKLYHRITARPWVGGYQGWTPND